MREASRRGSIPHVAALDGARGLAVAGVLLFHGSHLKGGYLGVDFFFTLSGFLITSLLLAESARRGTVGLGGFWARRARRLLPALAVLMVGIAIYSATLAKPIELSQIRGDAFATLGYVANWHEIFSHSSYFALFSSPSPLNHTWSLAIEEQFYVIWPLVFVGLLTRFKRATPKAVLVTSLALAALSSVLMITLYDPANSSRVYFGTDTRSAAILFGAALAAWLSVRGPTDERRANVAIEAVAIAGAAILAVAWTRLDGQSSTLYHGGFLVCGLAATAIIAAAIHPGRGPVSRVLSFRPLCALGLISYGVYLYHWPIDVVFDQERVGVRGWPLFAAQTAVTLAVSIASYRLLEQPIRHGALRAPLLRKLTPAVALALGVALFAATTTSQATPTLTPPLTAEQGLYIATVTRRAAPAGARRVMLAGDSVAADLGPAFRAIHTIPPLTVFNEGQSGCIYPSEAAFESFDLSGGGKHTRFTSVCPPTWEARLLQTFEPQLVFMLLGSPANRVLYNSRWIQPCSEPYDSLFQHDLEREVIDLRRHKAHVVIATTAYARNDFVGTDRYTDCNNRLIHKVAANSGAQLVDLAGYICPNGTCRTEQNGVTLRSDGFHYQGAGGEIVAKWLLSQVDES